MREFNKGDAAPAGMRLFRKKTITPMLGPMDEPFVCESREGTLQGRVGDYVAQDGHGGFYPISAEFHAANYEPAPQEGVQQP